MDISSELISVIIPAYNHEKYVQKTIRSLIDQTYKNLELIVIDDGSCDDTWNKINQLKEECEKRFARVLFCTKKNKGITSTLNNALKISLGKYIYYIASDDIANPNAIEILHKNIGNSDFIFPDISWIDSDGNTFFLDENYEKTYDPEKAKYKTGHQAYTNVKWPNIDDDGFDFYSELLKENCLNIGGLLLKQAVVDVGGWNKNIIIEDYYMHLQIAKRLQIKRLKDVLFFYRQHDTNWSKNSSEILEGIRRIFMNEKKYCYNNGYRKDWNEIFKERYYLESSFWEKFRFRLINSIYKKFVK